MDTPNKQTKWILQTNRDKMDTPNKQRLNGYSEQTETKWILQTNI
jgi:hypothetical protein